MEKGGDHDVQQENELYDEEIMITSDEEVRRGPWTVDEDFTLINYIAHHGEGRWNSLARCAGLKRTGKSCRLRWLNYLRPDVRRGNITLEEQLLILELHSRWGNRWSKIAQHLPGRTDNEIKNYWRTRVQKHAKQLKCDVNSKQFKDTMRYLWMPRLVERIQASASAAAVPLPHPAGPTPENSISAASSESFGTTTASDLTECYNNYPIINNYNNNNNQDCYYPDQQQQVPYNNNNGGGGGGDDQIQNQTLTSPSGYFDQGTFGFMTEQNNNNNSCPWMDGGDVSDGLWNDDDMWLLQQHQFNSNLI